jgi:hypothetical protein
MHSLRADKSAGDLELSLHSSNGKQEKDRQQQHQKHRRRLRRSSNASVNRIEDSNSDETSSSLSEVESNLVVSAPLHHQQQPSSASPLHRSLQDNIIDRQPSGRRLTEELEQQQLSSESSIISGGSSSSSSMTLPTPPTTIGDAILNHQTQPKKKTLVVYSGPTSLDRSIGKNDVYLANFDYFIQHGIECHGLGGTDQPQPHSSSSDQSQQQEEESDSSSNNNNNHLEYVIVVTQPVANQYTGLDGLITQKQYECGARAKITVLVREDRCYDMESLLLVSRTFDIPHQYDHMVYINCGLAGPKFGPGSPQHWENLSSWTELYTSLLSDKIQMVGHTINTHFNTVYSPHVQSFLFAINTPMIDIWIKTGSIYECGISNEDFKDDLVKMALVWRYEVGISRVLLERGHSIAAAFMHQQGRIGEPLIINGNSTFGRHFNQDEIIHSDVFLEDGVRMLTESTFPEYDDHRKYAILPWDCYVFFKVSRLIPFDVQQLMQYENLGPVKLVQNDARRSSLWHWRRKAGVSFFDELAGLVLGDAYFFHGADTAGRFKCHGSRDCQFEEVATATGGVLCLLSLLALFLWYLTSSRNVRRRIRVLIRTKRTKDQKSHDQ